MQRQSRHSFNMTSSRSKTSLLTTTTQHQESAPDNMQSAASVGSSSLALFGGGLPWSPLDWTASDDRVRNGSSQSYLDTTPGISTAVFRGTLDIKTLGGAGFASQRTTGEDRIWNLTAYDGLEIDVAKSDGKRYTFTVKDQLGADRGDGRDSSSISWEFEFGGNGTVAGGSHDSGIVYVPWGELNATYRGREQPDAKPLDIGSIKRFSLMMRSYFGEQEGEFELVVGGIKAVKRREKRYRDEPASRESVDEESEKHDPIRPRQSWVGWVFGGCGIL